MDETNQQYSDVLGLLKSWVPWRSEPANVSRDFWMPDQSCRVCYECDSQFTLFNRRHHCRLCGRIFCGKCTSNWIPAQPSEPKNIAEEWDRIRVCNYCFKQQEQGQAGVVDNGHQVAGSEISSASPSATSFVSSKSSGTCGSSSITFASLPQSAGFSPHQSAIMETTVERQNVMPATTNDHAVDREEQNQSQKEFEFFQSRSDEDDDLESPHLNPGTRHFPELSGYYEHKQFEDVSSTYKSHKVHPDGYAGDSKSLSSSPFRNSFDSFISEEVQRIVRKGVESDVVDEYEASASLYGAEDADTQPVDFENDGLLWLPPEPEEEDDEKEALLFEGDDDTYAAGHWGYLRNSSSFGSGESRNRDRSNEEHKRVMKTVVDGHFRGLVAQLLQVENLLGEDENDQESWLEIITALSWEAATLLKPDTSKSGQMDPGGYVKVKCLASGLRSESLVVKGIVCKKNVAHRRMASKIEKPRLMILGGALEYQRVSNALSSLDTLLQQEMDHLKMAVAKIGAQKPDILLVEKSVSRHAQEYLLAKDISLVLNIKRPLLERISRCTGAQIVPSIDHMSSHKLGYCDAIHVERYLEEHGSAGQAGKKLVKTLMYFEGCPKPLGCTILLRGANGDELKKVKHVVQYGVFAAYHLALETSFLADEGASLPEFPLNSPITVALPDKTSTIGRSISTVPDVVVPASEIFPGPQSVGEPHRSNSVPTSELLKEAVASSCQTERLQTYNPPSPMSSEYVDPLVPFSAEDFQHSALNMSSEDRGIVNLAWALEGNFLEGNRVGVKGDSDLQILPSYSLDSDTNRNVLDPLSLQLGAKPALEEQPALKEEVLPSPSDHQSILVSLSSRCVWKGTVCERSHLFRIKYYGSFDKPLGRFLHDQLFDQSYVCRSCEMPAEAHVQCYTHRQGTLTISVKKLSKPILRGEKDGKIWMWHRCLRCPKINGFPPAIRRVVMSDAAWGLSFGKFLELSFSNHAAASRVASCGHSLHRDCLRFYGYGNMVACFRYAPISVHSVYLPPSKLGFSYERQEWLERELNEVIGRAELLFSEVLNAICLLVERHSGLNLQSSGISIPESRRKIAEAEDMLQKEKIEFEELIQKILNKEAGKGQPVIDILELNQLRRQLVFQSYLWDQRLKHASSLDVKNRPEDTGLASPELTKKLVYDTENILGQQKILDINVSTIETDAMPSPDHGTSDEIMNHLAVVLQRNDECIESDQENKNLVALHPGTKVDDGSDPVASGVTVHRALSEGQEPICLSDTLDAAWTGENYPVRGIPKNKSFPGTVEFDSPCVSVPDKSDSENPRENLNVSKMSELPSIISTKGLDDDKDNLNWLGIPFLSFYQSLDTYFVRNAPKFLSEYNPVYISSLRESEVQGGARLLLNVGVDDTVVPVYDDEPTSIISFALVSPDYIAQMGSESDRTKDGTDSVLSIQLSNGSTYQSFFSLDETLDSFRSFGSVDENMLSSTSSRTSLSLDPVSYDKALHARVSFSDDGPLGKVKYSVTCYYAKRFEALRKICCPSEVDFIRSLSRCKKWGAQGGKSNVFFAKTLDDRFIIKQVTKTELESFIKFAPDYFKYLSESISTGSPTCLAKILGIYQVTSKHLKGGKETKMDVLVMENLLFGRNLTRLYDLKGSSRSRYNADASGSNKVLLDQNLIEAMPTSPIFVGNKAKRLLERAVWNDTAFLASKDVMDYSLLVGIDEERQELVLGIIDFMRQYTWDKHLETWVKASILGGPKNASPTVISPKQYKKRFRKAMTTYFLMVPDQWSPPKFIPSSKSQSDLCEESTQQHMETAAITVALTVQ
ncbi:1-phosphatidylinositol-3-phosphate 5-kinase FAB1B-like isoform X2 [Andrographis paniculata]|uniref:1-phosphatidylinositol-3-phosphate 5-kinase FAB1B-like isoform X2 n=1 Tax=Andrographis paniculata TaxID=175694 RepID=UPI0021E94BA9|nr:1-phosphatidylinositol-3-phosphate 5-kinase FAB1B-like isoform X2 [Andrographis paniculata]